MNDIKILDLIKNGGESGIVNMGNTCYMNSVLQCIIHNYDIVKLFLSKKYLNDLNELKKESNFCKQLYTLIVSMYEDDCNVQPITLKSTLDIFYNRYMGYNQHDSHECLVAILDLLHIGMSYKPQINFNGFIKNKNDEMAIESIKSWKKSFEKEYSYIIEQYYGQYLSTLKCTICNYESHTFQPFNILDFPVLKDKSNLNLDILMMEYVEPHKLDDNNMWKCEKCNNQCNAIKSNILWDLPKNLIIKFDRFDNNNNKINTCVDFPFDFRIDDYTVNYFKKNTEYELYSVINHFGNTNGGHYNAYCKKYNGEWCIYDDDDVKCISLKYIISNNAYILFYRMK